MFITLPHFQGRHEPRLRDVCVGGRPGWLHQFLERLPAHAGETGAGTRSTDPEHLQAEVITKTSCDEILKHRECWAFIQTQRQILSPVK